MKSNLLLEIEKILSRKGLLQEALPIPRYFFVERYGRSIENEMKEITALLGKKEWFFFKTGYKENGNSI